ncbi:hypothetical protein, partial [Salmonella enterica]|uniref:hypothetical protein n=1 Tax=Salmonella enterica TaxID=28901 RepID=UPI0032974DDF
VVAIVAAQDAYSARASAAEAQARSMATQQTVTEALSKLDQANRQLTERGQAPVQTSPDPYHTEAITASVLAQVLAQLPP